MTRQRRNRAAISLLIPAVILIVAGFAFWVLVTLQPAGFTAPAWASVTFLILGGIGVVIGVLGGLAQIAQFVIDRFERKDKSWLISQIYDRAPLRHVTYESLIQTLGGSGQIPWMDRNLTTPSLFSHHDCVAILGVMKSGKSREAYELVRRTLEQGIVSCVYEPTSSLDLIAENDLGTAIQLHLDSVPAIFIIDELDLRQSDEQLHRLSMCMETITAQRPDTRYIVTLQHERLTPYLKNWLDGHSFYPVSVPVLSPTERRRLVFDGAATLHAAITPSALDRLAANPAVTRPWDIVQILQAAPKTTSNESALDDDAISTLMQRTEPDLWAEQRSNAFKAHPLAQPLLDSIVVFLSAGITAQASNVLSFAVWLATATHGYSVTGEYSKKSRTKVQTHLRLAKDLSLAFREADELWRFYDIVSSNNRYTMPEPRLLPLLIEISTARSYLNEFASTFKPGFAERARIILTLPLEGFYWVYGNHIQQWGVTRRIYRWWMAVGDKNQVIRLIQSWHLRSRLHTLLGHSLPWLIDRSLLLEELGMPIPTQHRVLTMTLQRAVIAERSGDYLAAIDWLDKTLAQNANNQVALAKRGRLYRIMNKSDQALADLNRAIDLDTRDVNAISQRGFTYWQIGEYGRAMADFSHAILLEPDNAWLLQSRGRIHQARSNYEAALIDFDRAVELEPQNVSSILLRSSIHLARGDYRKALNDCDRCIRLSPKSYWAVCGRGISRLAMADYEEALSDFSLCIQLDPKRAEAQIWRSIAYSCVGNDEQSMLDLTEGIQTDYRSAWHVYKSMRTYAPIGAITDAFERQFRKLLDASMLNADTRTTQKHPTP